MSRLIRSSTWVPFALPTQLKPYDAPMKVRLFGADYVAWRAPDGRVGFVDQACPHRRVSLALVRNEGCAIRCIFHGWAIDVTGKVVEAPSQGADQADFCARVEVAHHPTREAGDLVWVWLGEGLPAEMPRLPIVGLPEGHAWSTVTKVACNWLQGLEGGLDTFHIQALHASWIERLSPPKKSSGGADPAKMLLTSPLTYIVEPTELGLSAIALRSYPNGSTLMRVTQYIRPFSVLIPGYPTGSTLTMSVPVDDENYLFFLVYFSAREKVDENWPPLRRIVGNDRVVREDFAPLLADEAANYGQDRALMAAGHYSGFPGNLFEEDTVVQVAMGRIADRTREHLSASDVAIVQMRAQLLRALREAEADDIGSAAPGADPLGFEVMVPPGADWRDAFAGQGRRDVA
ncbi:MAG: Rieske 2Fe-2S domain-containing protein [Caulobacteraceae bacterium]|nr:Rieske 2Fe-2S domain-containing protein [Caulobacteraceae bacterium]